LLQQIGLEPERVRFFNLSSAMGGAFAAAATEMTGQVEALGPNPLRRADNGSPTTHQEMSS
jgi:coenzyme F420-reducing hydrogenase delta subunit